MIRVDPADPREPRATALLEQSQALMQRLFAEDACHYLPIDALCGPAIRFFLATEDGTALGTGALALKTGYGEVKSMFTAPAARGKGAASALLGRIESTARAEGLPLLRLETGTGLDAAHRLYARAGFTPCGPFGDYAAAPTSLFMEKPLT